MKKSHRLRQFRVIFLFFLLLNNSFDLAGSRFSSRIAGFFLRIGSVVEIGITDLYQYFLVKPATWLTSLSALYKRFNAEFKESM